jgi:RNA polymerase sigma-70 factor (ECF subfamily)
LFVMAALYPEAQEDEAFNLPGPNGQARLCLKTPNLVGTWLHRLAVNVMLGHRRTAGVERTRLAPTDDDVDRAATRRDAPEARLDFELAIARLPDGARQVFVLHDVEGYTHEEIARLLGVVPGTSKSQLHHARTAVRRYL